MSKSKKTLEALEALDSVSAQLAAVGRGATPPYGPVSASPLARHRPAARLSLPL